MQSKLFFRQAGVIPCRGRADRIWAAMWPLVAIASLLAVLLLAGYWDKRAEQVQEQAQAQRQRDLQAAYGRGLRQGQADMLATAEAGWGAARDAAAPGPTCALAGSVRRAP